MWRGLVAGVTFALGMIASNAMAESPETLIGRVLDRRICVEAFWRYDGNFSFGQNIDVSYLFANGRGYAWSDDFGHDRIFQRSNRKLFAIGTQGRKSLVTRYFYDFSMSDLETFRYVKKMMRDIPRDPQRMTYQIPGDCTPQFDPPTPWKAQAVEKIARAVEKTSRELAKPGDPSRVEIVIADFNFDYPETAIYVPQSKMLLYANFRDEFHPLKDLASLDKMSISRDMRATDQSIKEHADKMMKYGIKRTIRWGGKS